MNTGPTATRIPRALLIFGMHRSGTSALAGACSLLGFEVPGTPLVSDAYNEKGLFESNEIVALNEALLRELGSCWDDPLPLRITGLSVRRKMALFDFVSGLATGSNPLIKDPRLCVLAAPWIDALANRQWEVVAILIARHPLEVALSLERRNGMPRAQALLLWAKHTLEAERATRGIPRSLMTYDELLADWRGALARAGAALQIDWPRPIEAAAPDIDAFLKADLRHHSTDENGGLGDKLATLCAQIWTAYQRLAEAGGDAAASRQLDAIGDRIDEAKDILAGVVCRPSAGSVPRSLSPELNGRRLFVPGQPEVWLMFHGRRHHLVTGKVFSALFKSTEGLHAMPSVAFIERGPDLDVGTCLVRDAGSNELFLVCGSKATGVRKLWISSPECFSAFGFDIMKVRDLSPLILAAISDGRELQAASA